MTKTIPFEDVGTDIKFYANGTGQAGVVATLTFVPAYLPMQPVMRGFDVQKVCLVCVCVARGFDGQKVCLVCVCVCGERL